MESSEYAREDLDLLEKLKGSGADKNLALASIRKRLMPVLRRKLIDRYSVDDGFVEDCVQETLLAVSSGISKFRGESRLFSWILTIGVRTALTELRKKRWKDTSLEQLVEDTAFDVKDSREGPEAIVERTEVIDRLGQLIDTRLTEKQRLALLSELSGAGTSIIAAKLGSTPGAIYKLAHDARRALRRELERDGFILDEVRNHGG